MTGATRTQDARERLLAEIPVRERHLELAGVSTALVEGGEGPPLVLLHGPGGHAAQWTLVLPALLSHHRVVAPDLPGHGETVMEGEPSPERVLAWLGALLDATCDQAPALLGHGLGGAIAARFASLHPDRVRALVLVDALGLVPFNPEPGFERVLRAFLERPGEDTHALLWERCAHDLDEVRDRLGERWSALETYNVARARDPRLGAAQRALMGAWGLPAIPSEELARIDVPTTLVWGRHDPATRLQVAETASARYGWPLHVIDGAAADPHLERPEAFLAAVQSASEAGHPAGRSR